MTPFPTDAFLPVLQRIHWFGRRHADAGDDGAPPAPLLPGDFSPRLWTRLLILQPTPFCNIDCDYCYLPDRRSTARMSASTVRLAARRLAEDDLLGPELTVVWHAGEPLVLPPSWYQDAIGIVREELGARTAVSHSIQTNATLIDDAWCALIRREHVKIGVSVDGPEALHDRHRRTRAGKGTHARVVEGLARLRAAGIPYHAIAVVTRDTLESADEFIRYFEAAGVTELGCNCDEAEGGHRHSSVADHEQMHARFLEQLLAWSRRSPNAVPVRELETARRLVARPMPQVRWQGRMRPENGQVLPWTLISVAHDGRFSTFSPELLAQASADYGDFVFGDVASGSYLEAARRPNFQRAWGDIQRGVQACESRCAYYAYCGGGSPVNKLYELGDLGGGETLYCRTMIQRPFDLMLRDAEAGLLAPPIPARV